MEIQEKNKSIKIKEKTFELISNGNHEFKISLINGGSFLFINASSINSLQSLKYQQKYSLDLIKKNKFFNYYETIDEILDELILIIENKKVSLSEEKNEITLIFQLPIKKIKEIIFTLKEDKKSDNEKIDELFSILMNLKKENEILKKEMMKKIENIENKLDNIEKKLMEKKEREIKIENIDSNILTDITNIELINNRLKNDEILRKKNIVYKLLYRATRDGDDASIFHQKCDNKIQILAVFKTTKGLIFGGYTDVGFKGSGKCIKDDKAFFFSCDLKKIYNVKKDKYAINDHKANGPIFGENTTIICVCGKMFDYNCSTCDVKSSCFDGISSDYEISNGDRQFHLSEIEVFQILYE